MKRIFIDANIVIDILLERELWMDDALCILSMADKGEIEAYCSSLSLATASYFMERVKMPHKIMMDKLDVFCQLCTPTTVDISVVKQAIQSSFHDFEDALQYYSSQTVKAEVIITRNGSDFVNSQIPVMTAAEFLASF